MASGLLVMGSCEDNIQYHASKLDAGELTAVPKPPHIRASPQIVQLRPESMSAAVAKPMSSTDSADVLRPVSSFASMQPWSPWWIPLDPAFRTEAAGCVARNSPIGKPMARGAGSPVSARRFCLDQAGMTNPATNRPGSLEEDSRPEIRCTLDEAAANSIRLSARRGPRLDRMLSASSASSASASSTLAPQLSITPLRRTRTLLAGGSISADGPATCAASSGRRI